MRTKLFSLLIVLASLCSPANAESVPIVKRFHLYNQTGKIGPITVYTPKHGGMFRVNAFVVVTAGNGIVNDLCPYVNFTTASGISQGNIGAQCGPNIQTAGNSNQGSFPLPM